MQGLKRKLVYVSLFETVAIVLTTLLLMLLGHDSAHSGAVSVVISVIAVVWNLIWNYSFEAWERRQTVKGRSIRRRLVHAVGFESGLALMTIPLLAWWLSIGVFEALALDIGLLLFFLLYTFVFNWGFDRIFGLPESAL
ncbi:PACE efflux transporter [Thiopseudomonas alkaliphila]|uniref:PACE efflux transporter n=1 Tax=Thiopseudomonas alkaliphila TaxID=1697053 RepID=A0AAW7DX56_9GAMM|nr:PACE efflux transporter [Thiopseudomonas alkaliphila]MDM1697286.1 PACE efflux transporter [Thiopseudomonas alkaliphila]